MRSISLLALRRANSLNMDRHWSLRAKAQLLTQTPSTLQLLPQKLLIALKRVVKTLPLLWKSWITVRLKKNCKMLMPQWLQAASSFELAALLPLLSPAQQH